MSDNEGGSAPAAGDEEKKAEAITIGLKDQVSLWCACLANFTAIVVIALDFAWSVVLDQRDTRILFLYIL
jgi:hypothetical protein